MAFLQVNYRSKALKKLITFNALIPRDCIGASEYTQGFGRPLKSLYLLHGYTGNYTDWLCGSKIQELSEKYNLAVFMPSGENSFYLDDTDKGEYFGEFVGRELVEYTRSLFPLSEQKEDTFIGGFSMGGYGAIRNGLKYAERFGRIIALSSALITRSIAGIPPDYKDAIENYYYYRRVFGDLNQLLGSDKDPEALITEMKAKNRGIPKIYMACGTEDALLENNRSYHEFLNSQNVKHLYLENTGGHNWSFWNEYIENAVLWALDD